MQKKLHIRKLRHNNFVNCLCTLAKYFQYFPALNTISVFNINLFGCYLKIMTMKKDLN